MGSFGNQYRQLHIFFTFNVPNYLRFLSPNFPTKAQEIRGLPPIQQLSQLPVYTQEIYSRCWLVTATLPDVCFQLTKLLSSRRSVKTNSLQILPP